MAGLQVPEAGVIRGYAIRAAFIALAAGLCFGAGYFVAVRIGGGSADLIQRYGAVVSNLDAARSAQREASSRIAGMSNELDRAQVSIGVLRSRNGELVATVGRLESINRDLGKIQSNLAGGIGRALDSATESGELINEFGIIARRLQAEGRGGN